ncbi:AAA-like domain-containing protein [Leptolyngbya ohadii]|uniref:AAA-like domain-containing protein n=1 Tax=Leptolyngbya ohadii TaxID=1962290 RepID=UPI000B59D241|nr:AAA-like domain-containing protein [Leptolyngbya ohadii]
MSSSTRKKKTILFLAANPKNAVQLRLDQEVKEIDAGLERSRKRDKFQLEKMFAVTPRDLLRAMQDYKPQIVHFAGHGVGEDGIVLEDGSGQATLVRGEALAKLFRYFAEKCSIECVVLNACYSEVQASAIAQQVPYVIGMNQAIGDAAAREFAVGFYDALGAGESIESAYENGCISISLHGIPEDLTPVLKRQSDAIPQPELEESRQPAIVGESRKLELVQPEVESVQKKVQAEVETPAPVDRPRLDLDVPEGQVPIESPLYVERPPIEARCYETIVDPGALIRIKAPRQMGKSSLMLRIHHYASEQDYQPALLNFQMVDRESLSSLDSFLQWFCSSITGELNLDDRLAEFWKGTFSPKNKCTNYFQRYLLPELKRPVVLCLDEVDQVFEYPTIATDFFGMLRAWHEDAKVKPIWKNLRLVIVHSKEVYIPLNINQSPFNVGVPIELPQLTHAQVVDLVKRHGLNWSDARITQLIDMVGGHPYLVRAALYGIARGELSLEDLLQQAPTEGGLYGEHLRRHLLNLENDETLLAAMKQVIAEDQAIAIKTSEAFKLTSMGLVRFEGSKVVPSCNLYRQYFRERLGVGA